MIKIKKFESFTIVNKSDLDKWSAEYNVNKEQGYLPYIETENGFVETDDIRSYKNYVYLDKNKVDELNNKFLEYRRIEKEYLEFLEQVKK